MNRHLEDWLNHNSGVKTESCRMGPARASDTIEFPEILVTEEPADADTARRFLGAEQRLALELIP